MDIVDASKIVANAKLDLILRLVPGLAMTHVDDAVRRRRLVLTLPWVVTFLSMADPVSLRLPSSQPLLCYLVWIFR